MVGSFISAGGMIVTVIVYSNEEITDNLSYVRSKVDPDKLLTCLVEINGGEDNTYVEIKGSSGKVEAFSNVNVVSGMTKKEVIESLIYSDVLQNFEGSETCLHYFTSVI